jgi:hypothetical protein
MYERARTERNSRTVFLRTCCTGLTLSLLTFVVEPYPDFLANKCVAGKKIEKPTARYSSHSDLQRGYLQNRVSRITGSSISISNISRYWLIMSGTLTDKYRMMECILSPLPIQQQGLAQK